MSGEHFDEVTLTVKVVTDARGAEILRISEVALPPDVTAQDVRESLDLLRANIGLRDGYVQTESRTTFEWGASGSSLQVVFETAMGVASSAVWAAAGWAAERALRRVGAADESEPVTVDDAAHSAQLAIRRTWGTEPEALTRVGEEFNLEEGTVGVSFIDEKGYIYEVEVGRTKHLLMTMSISRQRKPE